MVTLPCIDRKELYKEIGEDLGYQFLIPILEKELEGDKFIFVSDEGLEEELQELFVDDLLGTQVFSLESGEYKYQLSAYPRVSEEFLDFNKFIVRDEGKSSSIGFTDRTSCLSISFIILSVESDPIKLALKKGYIEIAS